MKQSIAILTHHTNAPFLRDLMVSLDGATYPIVILNNDCANSPKEFGEYLESLRSDHIGVIRKEEDGYDPQLLQVMYEETDYDEWVFLHDTCVVKKLELLDMLLKTYAGRTVSIFPEFLNVVGKYTRSDLSKVFIPVVTSKKEAVEFELKWLRAYSSYVNTKRLFFEDDSNDVMYMLFEQRYGREVLVIKNDYIIKYKHSWSPTQEEYFKGRRNAVAHMFAKKTPKPQLADDLYI